MQKFQDPCLIFTDEFVLILLASHQLIVPSPAHTALCSLHVDFCDAMSPGEYQALMAFGMDLGFPNLE